MLARYVHGAGADVPLVWYVTSAVGTATRRYLVGDRQGSIIVATSSGGAPLFVDTYDEYGVPGAGNSGRFQYTGQAWLPELGMYYYKARIYSPTLGRFMQTDPIGYADQFNLYEYVGNDPVNEVDPDGRRKIDVYIWNPRIYPLSVGHVMMTEHNSTRVLTSQFPEYPGEPSVRHGPNIRYPFGATIRAERRLPDVRFVVDVPNDAAFDREVARQVHMPTWDWAPDGCTETHCAFATATALRAGGVDIDNSSALGDILPGPLAAQLRSNPRAHEAPMPNGLGAALPPPQWTPPPPLRHCNSSEEIDCGPD
jgi:RHS repeat-associated protein